MKKFRNILLLLFIITAVKAEDSLSQTSTTKSPLAFFTEQDSEYKDDFIYNRYENIISGIAAFIIGNVGYAVSDSSSLQLSYAAIQTIGIVNIGQGMYKLKKSTVRMSLQKLLNNPKYKHYSKDNLAKELLRIFAIEERAKRLSIFYGSSFLALQYVLNSTVYNSNGKLKNIYLFLGGVNLLISTYSGTFKGEYEKQYFGSNLDISPFVYMNNSKALPGVLVGLTF